MTKPQTRAKSKSRRWIENSLFLAGVIALGVWFWSVASNAVFQDWESWAFDRKIRGERSTIAGYVAEKKNRIAAVVRASLGFPATPEPSMSYPHIGPPSRPTFLDKEGLVGRLAIPRLHLSAMVREGADEKTLGLALGHIPGTALPGQKGNVGVAGHRDTLFRGLREIDKNDLILFETFAGRYVYRVENTEIVSPQNVNVLKARDCPELTLVTCYPFHYIGSAPERFIVKARQVPQSQADQELTEARQDTARRANHRDAARQVLADDVQEPAAVRDSGADRVDRTALGRKAIEHKPGVSRVTFEVSKDHSRQLSPGISLGLTGIELAHLRVNGWIWVMPDRRTIWLRDHSAREPVVFYGHLDGKQRELVITGITTNSVKGYLLGPEDRTSAMSSEPTSGPR
jgi:sortase A